MANQAIPNDGAYKQLSCKICNTPCAFSKKDFMSPFTFRICSRCKFPIAHQEPNNRASGINPEKVREYQEAVEKWIVHYISKFSGEIKPKEEPAGSLDITLSENSVTDPKIEETLSQMQKNVEALQKTFVSHINPLNRAVKSLSERIETVESDLTGVKSFIYYDADADDESTEKEDVNNTEAVPEQSAQHNKPPAVEPSIEQAREKESTLAYNRCDADVFIRQTSAKRAGATNKTMEVDRLAQRGEAIFETGNGNYWLFTRDYPNLAFLVPNRKTLKINPNTIDSLKICFELTRDRSLRNLDFEPQNADMSQVELVYPAVLDIFDSEKKLWKIRKKGVLLFPS